MKKFTKLFLSCAAVAAVATAVGVSAMAADITGDVKGTFNEETKVVTIDATASAIEPAANTQVTFLVFKGAADTDISADSVVGIDQGTTVQPTNNGLKSTVVAPAEGQPQDTYTVKIGYYNESNTFTVKSGTFKLGEAAGVEILVGDANQDEFVDGDDAKNILQYNVDKYTFTGNGELAADANRDTFVDGDDAGAILRFNVDKITAGDNDKVNTKITVDVQ